MKFKTETKITASSVAFQISLYLFLAMVSHEGIIYAVAAFLLYFIYSKVGVPFLFFALVLKARSHNYDNKSYSLLAHTNLLIGVILSILYYIFVGLDETFKEKIFLWLIDVVILFLSCLISKFFYKKLQVNKLNNEKQ